MMKHPIWRAQRWMLDLLNPPSQTWRGRRNDRIADLSMVDAVLNTWAEDLCSDDERKAAKALLDGGLEDRPLNAIERAHAALVAVRLLDL